MSAELCNKFMRIKKGVDAHVVMSDASELRVSLQTNVVARS